MGKFVSPLALLAFSVWTSIVCRAADYSVVASLVKTETCLPANTAVDPGETVKVEFTFRNDTTSPTPADTSVRLMASGGVLSPGPAQLLGALDAGAAAAKVFDFTAAQNACGSTLALTFEWFRSSDNSILGSVPFPLRLGLVSVTPRMFGAENPVPIPDDQLSSGLSLITVTGLNGTVSKGRVILSGLSHPYPRDLDIVLESPSGQRVMLMSDAGPSSGDDTPLHEVTLTFDDLALQSVPIHTAILTGTYKPTDIEAGEIVPGPTPPYGTALAPLFTGPATNLHGTWKLYLFDDQRGDSGSLKSGWSLVIDQETVSCCIPGPPSIGTIPDSTTPEDTALTLSLTLADSETGPDSLVVTYTTDNTTLVPAGSLTLAGTGANRLLTIRPATNQSGSARITLTARDPDAQSSSRSFLFTVTAVNDAPVIQPIADQTTLVNQALGPLSFTIGDAETPVNQLVVIGKSSNTNVVPDTHITLAGTEGAWRILVSPGTNVSGATTISVSVVDGQGVITTELFLLTVTPSQQPEMSVILDQSIPRNEASPPIPFTIGDFETPAEDLELLGTSSLQGLIRNASIVFGGSASNRTVTLTPEPDQAGRATISITLRDRDGRQLIRSFVATVAPPNPDEILPAIPNQSTPEDVPASIPFVIRHPIANSPSLILHAASSNSSLVPATNLVFSGSGSNRILRATPARNASGNTTLTLAIQEGEISAVTTFNLAVDPVNDAPSISPVVDFSHTNSQISIVPVSVGDIESQPSQITLTAASSDPIALPPSAITVVGDGAQRTVRVGPVPGAAGRSVVSLTARDPQGGTATMSFTVRIVNASPVAPRFSRIVVSSTQVSLELTGQIGDVYSVESAPFIGTWIALTTVTNMAGTVHVIDPIPSVPGQASRFYRAHARGE